ncbi:MAG: hypothetical protein KJ666_12925, partial [Bacteroidetes bacterium]|nr:hypothetical protein [Bacteroidota bacterium]
ACVKTVILRSGATKNLIFCYEKGFFASLRMTFLYFLHSLHPYGIFYACLLPGQNIWRSHHCVVGMFLPIFPDSTFNSLVIGAGIFPAYTALRRANIKHQPCSLLRYSIVNNIFVFYVKIF